MADYERPILFAEDKFFDECNAGNGRLFHCHCHWHCHCHNFDVIIHKYLLLLC